MTHYGLVDFAMTFHHTLCILGQLLPMATGVGANYVMMGMYIGEISNTLMHIRVILKHFGLRYTKAYETSEIGFILLYIYGRFLLGPSIVWQNCMCVHNHIVVKVGSVGITIQSFYFGIQMVQILMKRYREIQTRKLKRVKNQWFTPLTSE